MCTAVTYKTRDFYFGRTLDYDFSYIDEVTITPRRYPFHFQNMGTIEEHYAMIGMAYVADGYPLYYDAVNEKGLGIAGLNFTGNAVYGNMVPGKENITQFEWIPWLLCQCNSVKEVRELLGVIQIVDTSFRRDMPVASLHWLIADRREAITVEAVREGIRIYPNPVGVLTNNPPFPEQMFRLNDYMHLSTADPQNLFLPGVGLQVYSRGMGALGLPGDFSSQSRFVRAVFTKMHAVSGDSEEASVSQFFHILGSVQQPRGCCEISKNETAKYEVSTEETAGRKYEITIYTSCCNASRGIYYYTTYDNHQITAVDMHRENLNSSCLIRYPLICEEQIKLQNA